MELGRRVAGFLSGPGVLSDRSVSIVGRTLYHVRFGALNTRPVGGVSQETAPSRAASLRTAVEGNVEELHPIGLGG